MGIQQSNRILLVAISLGISLSLLYASQTNENSDFLYARRLYDDGMLELAAKQFRAFMENYPTSPRAPEALLMAGEAYFKANLFDEARQAFLEVTVRFPRAPKNDEAQFKIGDCYQAKHSYLEAAQAYHRVKVFYPRSTLAPSALLEAGRMYTKAGDYARALEMYFSFLEEYPEDPNLMKARLEVVTVLTQKGELQRALNEADKLIGFAHKGTVQYQTCFQKGRILEEMGRLKEAQQEYLNLLQKPVDNDLQARVNLRLGYIYRLKGEWNRSNEYFLSALKAKGEIATQMETFLMLGDNYFNLSQFAQAQENYLKVVSQAGKDDIHYFEALYKTALAYESLADFKNANQFYLRLLNEYLPTNRKGADYREQSYLRIASNYLQLNDGVSAISYFRKYLDQYPDSKLVDQLNFKVAQIYQEQLNNPDKALRIYDHFLESFPQSIYIDEALLGIAHCYEALGNYDKALMTYQNFLITYPGGNDYPRVKEQVKRLEDYHLKHLEKGLAVLSQLIGESLSNQSSSTVLLKLANLNYDQLKDYQQALRYYQQALKLGTSAMSKDELYFRIGQCYLKLAFSPTSLTSEIAQPAMLDSARRIFQLVADAYVDGEWADDAAIALAEMPGQNSASPLGTALDYYQMLKRFPRSSRTDYILLKLGTTLIRDRRGTISDSLQTAAYYFQQILTKHPASSYACAARYYRGYYFAQVGDYFNAQSALENYLENYPRGESIVQAQYHLAEIMRMQQNYTRSISLFQKISTNYFYSPYADSACLKLGDVLLEQGEYQTALNHLLEVYEQFGKMSWSSFDQPRARLFARDELEFKIAQAYEKLNDLDQAKIHYQNYLKMSPNGQHVPPVLLALGKITSATGQQDAEIALSYFDRLKYESSDNQINYSAAIQAADLLFQERKYEAAQKEYQRSLQFAATMSEKEYPQAQIIVCSLRRGELTSTNSEIDRFEKEFGSIPQYMAQFEYEKGEHFLNKKSFETAEKIFNDLRKKYKPTEYAPKAELALGELYIKTNKDEKALDIITQIPDKYPESEVTPLAYISLADYFLKKANQPENAISLYKKAIEHPKVALNRKYALQNLIKSYELIGMYDQVLALVREHLKTYPNDEDNFQLRLKIGTSYKALKQYDLAIAQFEKLKQSAGAEYEAEVQYNLAECYELMGQYEKAITEYLKVKYIAKKSDDLPWDVTAQYKAALNYIKLKQYSEAKTLLEKIIRSWGAQSDFGRAASNQLEEIKRLEQEG